MSEYAGPEAAELVHFLPEFVKVWSEPDLACELAQALSCVEVEALATVLSAGGDKAAANIWRQAHSVADEPGDQHYDLPTPDFTST